MNNFSVSCGQKIPLIQCKIKDKEANRFVPAIFYEYDCTDMSDIEEINNTDGKWAFKGSIVRNMQAKYAFQLFSSKENPNKFYALQTKDGTTIGISQVHNKDNNTHIDFIERRRDKDFKYVGQNIIASIGFETLKENGGKIIITSPTDEAVPFYKKICGFKENINGILKLNKKHIKKLLKQTQNVTNSSIIDLRA